VAEITPITMKRDLDAVASETFDLIVVRGGIIAAGITRGAALHGFRTLLPEKDDFASAMNHLLFPAHSRGLAIPAAA